jgi:inosose dehydratase
MGDLETPSAWPELEKQVRKTGELLAALGSKFLVLIDDLYNDLFTGKLKTQSVLDENAWKRLIDTTNRVADLVLNSFGLTVVFHPHAATHVEYEHQIQALLEQTDPELVSLCFDTGHHAYRGGDPVSFMRRHHRRIPYLHLKNVNPTMQKKFGAENMALATVVGMGMFCEPSRGLMDYAAFRDVLLEIDYAGFAIVEQDMYPTAFDKPLPIAKRTRAYLREIGIG